MTIIKYKPGYFDERGGFVILAMQTVFVEIGGPLDDEQALQDWLKGLTPRGV